MVTLVVGATGATGRLLVQDLLSRGQGVRALVRTPTKLDPSVRAHPRLALVQGSLLDLDGAELTRHVAGCDAVASCLGHTVSLRGIYGPPYRLVTEATRRLCAAIRERNPGGRTKFVLMNTAGNRNRGLAEPVSRREAAVLGLLRLLVPPHADNEDAAEFLRMSLGPDDDAIEWAAVRPDTLVDRAEASDYEVYPSPTRSAIFDPGRTSRVNVARFMGDLITSEAVWGRWRGRMPVIYDAERGRAPAQRARRRPTPP